ncbi:MAG TPA: type II toxin-antitoxin system VapB family antitoxin [Hydrogenophaga sp.]|nr:type II toxin-antitoxin system VapB family antitoxin [Hydrogenophaga sp.]
MRTNIDIDDALMAAAMAAGGFKTKKEAVEEGLRLVRRRKVYEGLLALRGKLQWDDSDEAWARVRAEEAESPAVQEPKASYGAQSKPVAARKAKPATTGKPAAQARSKRS